MRFAILKNRLALSSVLALAALGFLFTFIEAQGAAQQSNPGSQAQIFENPQSAADALVIAASKVDVPELKNIFGEEGSRIVLTGEEGLDRDSKNTPLLRAKVMTSISTRNASSRRPASRTALLGRMRMAPGMVRSERM